ncbi:putative dithiol-disulfide oxidoreductase (DUF899 family) [Streptomyces umbrinus]|uniref:Dithiol-disulfide oxidoreductase (DUF899 family) n=1 Tax=Streptomyces umbrinus TaxID=67370 RepID=A0ABU0TC67_9ACTN|nr:putative dithiol-disulfide oxidoreductase (DUF899 family) [Streptomyces umbrinus]
MSENPSKAQQSVVDRATFEQQLEGLRAREKAHTREGDAIAAARRRLPMVEVAADSPLLGPDGPMTLLDAFEGRRQMIAYYFMWWPGRPAAEQCEGCTWVMSHVGELAYLHSRDITFAVFLSGAEHRLRLRGCADVVRGEPALSRLHGLDDAVVLRPALA